MAKDEIALIKSKVVSRIKHNEAHWKHFVSNPFSQIVKPVVPLSSVEWLPGF